MPVKKSVKKSTVRRNPDVSNDKMVPFGRAVANFFKKYAQFNGVATRAEYWWAMLFWACTLCVLLALPFGLRSVGLVGLSVIVFILLFVFCIGTVVPMWAVSARRLHDAGFTAKLLWVNFVFFLCSVLLQNGMQFESTIKWLSFMWSIVMFVLFVFPSKKRDNPYRS